MFMQHPLVIISLILCLSLPMTAVASVWEEIFYAESGETKAKVEMKKYSFKTRLTYGEKIVNAHLRMFFRKAGKTARATGDYEVHCAARKTFRSNSIMKFEDINRTKNTLRAPKKIMLEGKEHQDFVGLMEILCARK